MPTKADVQKFVEVVNTTVTNELNEMKNELANETMSTYLQTEIYVRIFETVCDIVHQLDLKISGELVNCIAQSLYLGVTVNGEEMNEDIFTRLVDPRMLPENERPFIYEFFAEKE